jgi:hypothetical protein
VGQNALDEKSGFSRAQLLLPVEDWYAQAGHHSSINRTFLRIKLLKNHQKPITLLW